MQQCLYPRAWVYPRVCGGTPKSSSNSASVVGLSPRVRGNLEANAGVEDIARSIPACAGEPRHARRTRQAATVYPRVCGGTGTRLSSRVAGGGLSPRVRGNRRQVVQVNQKLGSIPACAGEPPKCR